MQDDAYSLDSYQLLPPPSRTGTKKKSKKLTKLLPAQTLPARTPTEEIFVAPRSSTGKTIQALAKGDFIIRSDKKKKKIAKQLSIGEPCDDYQPSLAVLKPLISQQSQDKKAKKKRITIPNTVPEHMLPRTGIEQAFARKQPLFIKETPDYESLSIGVGYQTLLKAMSTTVTTFEQRVVYDSSFIPTDISGKPAVSESERPTLYFEKMPPFYKLKSNMDSTLVFESRFESGNLARVTQIGEYEYDLELKFDHGCPQQYSQWFYFKVSNTRRKQIYKFNIVNLLKSESLYSSGMKPLMYSKKEAEFQTIGWQRFGADITYYPTLSHAGLKKT
jgi:Cytosolic carboxypeptidase N-terminal domain